MATTDVDPNPKCTLENNQASGRKHRTASSDLGIDKNLSHKTPNHKKPTYWDFIKIKILLFNKRQESEKLSHQLGKGFTACTQARTRTQDL